MRLKIFSHHKLKMTWLCLNQLKVNQISMIKMKLKSFEDLNLHAVGISNFKCCNLNDLK